ncbi:DMT family transporter [Mesorhizobium escarrei]|uniref:Threonine/homoserine efflux transporter RhtA n=1 Tax=Mesorhizobium escarrei TaxID=666018 RepID=A0ABN8JJ70_9HYPH|nr:DMT family transporter [Mesorhizobium escarrei]CAH2397589.1 Threonine/homoserine efflux transporter RhtA [Mesorhizobium escarrei]
MSVGSTSPRPDRHANASPKLWLAWSLLGLLGFIWGTNFLFMKMAVAVVPPLEVAWLRTIFGALPIAALALVRGSLARTDWRFVHHFAAMALLANVGPYVFFVIGTAHLPSGVAGVISGAIPFVTAAIVAVALPAERLTRVKALGLGIGFAGVLLVAPLGGAASASGGSPLIGVAAMLAGSVSYALALVYARRFMVSLGLGPVKLATYQMLFAAVLLAPFAAPGHWSELAAHREALLALVFGLGLAGTGIAFVIYYQLIQMLGALKAASVYYIPPVVALVVGWAFAGETITLVQTIGAVLVMAGIFYAIRDRAG